MRACRLVPLVSGLAVVLALASAAHPQAPSGKPPGHDPEALRLFDDVVKAYKSLTAYADQGKFSVTPPGGKPREAPLSLTFVRPNKIDFKAGPIRLLSDGKDMITVIEEAKRYTVETAPKLLSLDTLTEYPAGKFLYGGPLAPTSPILLNLLIGDAPLKNLVEQSAQRLRGEADRIVEGKTFKCFSMQGEQGPGIRLYIDPKTKLVNRIEGLGVGGASWIAGAIATRPSKDEVFQFRPPRGFTKVNSALRGIVWVVLRRFSTLGV